MACKRLALPIVAAISVACVSLPLEATAKEETAPGQQPPTNSVEPSVDGSPELGETQNASVGDWSGVAIDYQYQWQRCSASGAGCSSIPGAISSSYRTVATDVGSTLDVVVTASNKRGSSSASSDPTALIAPAPTPAPAPAPDPTTTATTTATTSTTTTTTPTTPTPTPSGSGSGLFTGDFETGDLSQWNWGSQCSNTGTSSDDSIVRGPVSVESSLVGEGGFAARFDLPANGLRQACEVLDHRPLVTDTYYSLMFYLPASGQTTNSWGTTLAQLNYQGIWGPPEGLFAVNSTTLGEAVPNAVIMVLQSGFCYSVYSSSPGCTNVASVYQSTLSMPAQYAVPPGQLTLGVWHELVCHIHFAVDSSGVFECWHKLKGQTAWTKTGSYTGYPTVQWTATPKLPSEDVDKIGAYRPGDSTAWTQYMDGFRAGTSFNAVAATLP
jgi:hypothetical protein